MILSSVTSILLAAIVSQAAAECDRTPSEQPAYCTKTTPAKDSPDIPRSFGYLIYPAFEPLDFSGPFDALNYVGSLYKIDIHLIAETLDPVTTRPSSAGMIPQNSSTFFQILPTTTLSTAPDLDVLIVPGGIGSRSPYLNATIDFIRDRYPKLKYLLSVCTGAILCSKSGVLDGRNATTNKRAYKSVTATNDKVHWVPEARWVTDGNIWTTSGVSSGIDGMMAFIRCIYGDEVLTNVTK
ncbi:hypothetical protein PRZ48_009687 [Zasmidium cellare]|uniref:DJ-1/PfpI domain-containing protein n=1 Tax=Zasmidium cellare TaxID=395010 RepID=A0ABR0ECE0_ZASCE|nr:hypothetical protein PRZ48_009687 [Zasmidium cellare]